LPGARELLFVTRTQNQFAPVTGELFGERQAQATRAAGDKHSLSTQVFGVAGTPLAIETHGATRGDDRQRSAAQNGYCSSSPDAANQHFASPVHATPL